MELSQRRARLLARLASSRGRSREGLVLVEGTRAVGEALDAGARVSFAVASPRLEGTPAAVAIVGRLRDADFDVARVDDAELDRLAATEHPQGVVLVCEEPQATLAEAMPEGARALVLDAVQDPGNVGTLVRSAVAFGFDGVVALDGTADPWGAKAVRASAGTVFHVPVARADAVEVLGHAEAVGLPLLVASAEGRSAQEVGRGGSGFALVVGNEGSGVRGELRAAAADTVAVVMRGGVESLNAGVAGSILMHDLTRAGETRA